MNPTNFTTWQQTRANTPPIVGELEAIFEALPDRELLARLRGPKRRGRPSYDSEILWRCYVAYYVLNVESVSALIRLLHDNPYVAQACGISSPNDIPSQPTFSRFGAKLAKRPYSIDLRYLQRAMTQRMFDTLPGFGRSVAIDSTHVKGWSNGNKKGKRRTAETKRQRPRVGKRSDPDAGWCVKRNTEGNKQFVWGYKVHILCDTEYELPMYLDISAGNLHDVNKASPLLAQARTANSKFHPEYVIADAGYSSERLRHVIKRQYRATPVIDPNPQHTQAIAKQELIPDWRAIYKRRTAIERLNGRLKGFWKLDTVRVRGKFKVRVHAILSVAVLQARALAEVQSGRLNEVRACTRKVA